VFFNWRRKNNFVDRWWFWLTSDRSTPSSVSFKREILLAWLFYILRYSMAPLSINQWRFNSEKGNSLFQFSKYIFGKHRPYL
jgi:hypothetical protein